MMPKNKFVAFYRLPTEANITRQKASAFPAAQQAPLLPDSAQGFRPQVSQEGTETGMVWWRHRLKTV